MAMKKIWMILLICLLSAIGCVDFQDPAKYKPRVTVSIEKPNKRLVFQKPQCVIRRIQLGNFKNLTDQQIAVLTQASIVILSKEDYRVLEERDFSDKTGRWVFGLSTCLIDTNHDGYYEIIERGGGYGEIGVLNKDRNNIWIYSGVDSNLPAYTMTFGDLNHDGNFEFYVADRPGLFQIDEQGKIIKKISDSEFYQLNIIDDNGKALIVGSWLDYNFSKAYNSEFVFFDYDGNVIRKFHKEGCDYAFDVVGWPEKPSILTRNSDNKIVILEVNANPDVAKGEDLAEAAKKAGITYKKFLSQIISYALARYR